MSPRMPLNYSNAPDATEMDGNFDNAANEVGRDRTTPGRDFEESERNPKQAQSPGGTGGGNRQPLAPPRWPTPPTTPPRP